MRNRPIGEVLTALTALGVVVDDGGRGSLPFTVVGEGRVPGGTVVIDASASSQFVSALLLAGARYDQGVDVRHDGKPVPSLPHIEMTIAMLRDRGVAVDDAGRQPLGGRSRTDRRARRDDRARPLQRCAVPGAGGGDRRLGHRARLARRHHPARRRCCATCCARWAARLLVGAGPDRHRSGRGVQRSARSRRRPARGRRAGTGGRGALRAGRDALAPARHRPHPRPRDRPARSPGQGARRPRRRRHRAPRRALAPAGAAHRRGVPHLRRPPDGACRRDHRRGRRPASSSRTSHDQQDVPRLRRLLGPLCERLR